MPTPDLEGGKPQLADHLVETSESPGVNVQGRSSASLPFLGSREKAE